MTISRQGAVTGLRPQRLLCARDAAYYLGVSESLFRREVKEGNLPQAKRLAGRLVWDILDLDATADGLPYYGAASGKTDDMDTFADWTP